MDNNQDGNKAPTAFLVDLVSNRKIPIATPRCRVGRDDLNDIVISGDQSISRFHFIISYENGEFTVQDAKSRHGTFLNGNQLTVSESIKDGDVLKVGVSLFWFVVEGAQGEATGDALPGGKVSAITDDEKAAAADNKVVVRSGVDAASGAPSQRSQEMTQEMMRPDPALFDKLEQAANSQKEDKPEPKTSLASLLADAAAQEMPSEADKKKEEMAALAARDKEMLEEAEKKAKEEAELKAREEEARAKEEAEAKAKEEAEAKAKEEAEAKAKEEAELKAKEEAELKAREEAEAEEKAREELKTELKAREEAEAKAREEEEEAAAARAKQEESEPAEPQELREEDLPARPINKHSDTVTLEAMPVKGEPEAENEAGATAEVESFAPEAVAKEAEADTKGSNAGIMDSARETREETSRDKAAFDAGSTAEVQISLSLPPVSGLGASQSMSDSGPNGSGSSKAKSQQGEATTQSEGERAIKALAESQDLEITKFIKAGANAVPDWCKRYFSDEIAKLNTELDELNEQVRIAQQKIRDVETRVALTRGIRNTLLTTTGDELVEACGKVLSLLGWKVTLTTEDKHELRLEVEDKHICIARVIWTTTKAERSHLGQLSISQTRYWMEKGVEPKGIIIVSKISGDAPTSVGDSPEEIELNDYAAKRNVCLMSTLQLLSLYKEIALADANPDKLRTSIVNASGWLAGHNLEPGTADINDDEGSNSQSSKVAMASA